MTEKMLRVRIDGKLWKEVKPHLRHGDISKIFRKALKEFMTTTHTHVKGKMDYVESED
jgi:hypothetical protein